MSDQRLAERLLATFAGELEERVAEMNAELLALEQAPDDPAARLSALFRIAHTLKGAASAAGVGAIARACHALESMLVEVRAGAKSLGTAEFALLYATADALASAGLRLRAGETLRDSDLPTFEDVATTATPRVTRAPSGDTQRSGHVRVQTEKLDALLAVTGRLRVVEGRLAQRSSDLRAFQDTAARSVLEWRRRFHRLRTTLVRPTPADLLKDLASVDATLELLAREARRAAALATSDADAVAQVAENAAERVRRLRMSPFAEICEPLPRAVRDVANTTGKQVRLEVSGGTVEADRAVLGGLKEPLLHLVRNAADHGIEAPRDRQGAGKPPEGCVRVAASLRGDRFVVTVADDGAGLDVDAIRQRLVELSHEVPADDHILAQRMFASGISSRRTVTDVSGRGVGLDVVRAGVSRIRGTIEVDWTPGEGTTFTMECPTSLATLRILLARAGTQFIGIPTDVVDRVFRTPLVDVRRAEGREVVPTAAGPVPLVSLAGLLFGTPAPLTGTVVTAVVLRVGTRRVAVAVEELGNEQEILVRPVAAPGAALPYVGGATILASGQALVVLNVAAVVEGGLSPDAVSAAPVAAQPGSRAARRRILVVDDSLTTRTLERSILEAAGYEVHTAVDGHDAWQQLEVRGADLVVADVEMPEMDGFALCATIRGSLRFATLPVVLVTGLETPEHRARGFEVGADGYLGKSGFEQEELLRIIDSLLQRAPA
jgi:two-component system chemotaxis sensor kinase CheA